MEFGEKLAAMAKKVRQDKAAVQTEEATKTSLIMPFIATVLGYDVFNLNEVVPEFIADVGLKKGEKIDYAILRDGQVQMLIECKKVGEPLSLENASQLFRYFHVTTARIACLTNGEEYRFYTDLDAPNKMDEKPFLVLDLSDIDDAIVPELSKLSKEVFDLESVISSAGELKYVSAIKREIATQRKEPTEDFVRVFTSRVYEGRITSRVSEQFSTLVSKSFSQYISDQVNERLKAALGNQNFPQAADTELPTPEASTHLSPEAVDNSGIETTLEEMEAYHIVRAIICSTIEVQRIHSRDAKSYFSVLIDNSNRKPVCRLHFNGGTKYLGLLDEKKTETRIPLDQISDLYNHSDALREAASRYA